MAHRRILRRRRRPAQSKPLASANKYGVPRIAFITRWTCRRDLPERDQPKLRDKLGANAWPVILPWGAEDQLHGQIDIINQSRRYAETTRLASTYELVDIPAELKPLQKSRKDSSKPWEVEEKSAISFPRVKRPTASMSSLERLLGQGSNSAGCLRSRRSSQSCLLSA